ncbi:hypothetical protein FOE78_22090 [Microlunatus elymi]|uniref:Uncharacterized protein n=1 Tax=Microlunatus elymi TaxID=2596828 RepID=A0A516Q457_9ACTN|nr:hypothetical protein [Microlunatus elymi]QDP98237.1 hypothetical protein FOE78_22090 [Microlunatus elymi]
MEDSTPADRQHTGTDHSAAPDLVWARRQRLLALVGTLVAILGLITAVGGLVGLAADAADARPYAITAVIGAAALALCCAVIAVCWFGQLRRWQAGDQSLDHGRARLTLIAHVASYPAVLVTMYGALAASALAYWDSLSGTLLGITFILVIFAQILGGTQLLRRSGPPGTIPTYLRKLNAKVQSLR